MISSRIDQDSSLCPLCRSKGTKLICRLEKKVKIVECKFCQIAYTSPPPKQPDYEDLDHHSGLPDCDIDPLSLAERLPRQWKKSLLMQAKLIQTHCLDARTVLEIGCGRGLLLALLRRLGFDVYGIEPNMAASQYCNRFEIPVHNAYFSKSLNHKQQIDIVILSHVLEHVIDPKSFVIDIVTTLEPKYLLLVQANYKSLTAMLQRQDWYAWAPDQHYFHFSVDGLNRLARSLGLTLVKNEYSELNSKRRYAYMQALLALASPRCKDQFHSLFQI